MSSTFELYDITHIHKYILEMLSLHYGNRYELSPLFITCRICTTIINRLEYIEYLSSGNPTLCTACGADFIACKLLPDISVQTSEYITHALALFKVENTYPYLNKPRNIVCAMQVIFNKYKEVLLMLEHTKVFCINSLEVHSNISRRFLNRFSDFYQLYVQQAPKYDTVDLNRRRRKRSITVISYNIELEAIYTHYYNNSNTYLILFKAAELLIEIFKTYHYLVTMTNDNVRIRLHEKLCNVDIDEVDRHIIFV